MERACCSMRACGVGLPSSHQRFAKSYRRNVAANLHIDRRLHMELAYRRQHQAEVEIQQEIAAGPWGKVWEVRNLSHLESIHEALPDAVVVVLAYTRSCGSCKMVLQQYQLMSTEAAWARAGVVYCKHDVRNEFDHRSDVARMFNIRHVPSFLFFVNGALVDRSTLPDTRTLYRPSHQVDKAMRSDMQQVNKLVRRLVFRNAPSAQKSGPT